MTGHVLASMNEIISYDYSNSHKALDIVSSNHSEENIIALESGVVTKVVSNVVGTNHNSKGLATYGNYVQIKQNNGKIALYAHMKYGSIMVQPGEYVEKGTVIGTMGETGNAYGKHLHLEITLPNNTKENPIISLNEVVSQEVFPIVENAIVEKKDTIEITATHDDIESNNLGSNVSTFVNVEYLSAYNYHYGSIVDALKSIGVDSSFDYRSKLASINGIENYSGSYSQNVQLLSLLKTGNLKKS